MQELEQMNDVIDEVMAEPEISEIPEAFEGTYQESDIQEPDIASTEEKEPDNSDLRFKQAVEEKVNKRIARERRRSSEQLSAVNQQLLEIRAQIADNYSHVSSAPPQNGEAASYGGSIDEMAAAFLKAQQIAQQQQVEQQHFETRQQQQHLYNTQDAELEQRFNENYDDMRDEHPDFENVVLQPGIMTQSMLEALKRTSSPAQTIYRLAKTQKAELQRIASLSNPIDQALEFTKLNLSVSNNQQARKPISPTPAPIRQEKPSGSTRPVSSDTIDFMRKTLAGR